jgi:DNA invertase Pin-like site-specific DNA recombinase
MKQLVCDMAELVECGVKFVRMKNGFDMTTSMGRAMAGMLSVFAALERDMIQERVLAGMANARAKGRFPGFKRQALDLVSIRSRIAAGESLRSCAKSLIKAWIGHGSERMVRLYTHLRPQYRSRVLASIPSLVGSKVAVIDPVDPLLHMEKVA